MGIYYIGTSEGYAKRIMKQGVWLNEDHGLTFGAGLYVSEEPKEAQEYGKVVLSIDVDDTRMQTKAVKNSEIGKGNITAWGREFAKGVVDEGYTSVKIIRDNGDVMTVIYDLSVVNSIKEIWRDFKW